jgi:NADP-dependent 3-hydroxy acid dehydrogenase YdfG
MDLGLTGKAALVTGGSAGIGKGIARALAREGADVAICARRRDALEATATELRAETGRKIVAIPADLTRTEDAERFVTTAAAELGRVDILVNNAGSSSRVRNIRWVGRDEWERVFAVNMTGVYLLTQAVLPGMIERGGGTIVTVSSAAAFRPGLLGGAPYGAAKAAVRNLMGHIHTVLRDKGIRATTILPAEVDTPILENRPLVPDTRARATMMQPEDVAAAILLCVTMPSRTVVEEIILSPTDQRDLSADLAVARDLGGPTPAP